MGALLASLLAVPVNQAPTVPSPYVPRWTAFSWMLAAALALVVLALWAFTSRRAGFARYRRLRRGP